MSYPYQLRPFLDHAVDAFLVHDMQGRILDISASALKHFGYSADQLSTLHVTDLIISPEPDQQHPYWLQLKAADTANICDQESCCRRSDGSQFPAIISCSLDTSTGDAAILTIIRDVSSEKHNEALLNEHDNIFRAVFNASRDAILLLDGSTFIDCNQAAVRMLRCTSKDDLLPTPPWGLSPKHQPDGRLSSEKAEEMIRLAYAKHFHRFEWIHTRADGENFPVEVTLTPIELGGRQILYAVWTDITDRKHKEQEIEMLAHYDALTGLPNRRLLLDRSQKVLEMAEKNNLEIGVLYMDLDRFKDINDTQGHDIGDVLLEAVAERFHDCIRATDTVARLGGDEFAFLLPQAGKERAIEIAKRLLKLFDEPFQIATITAKLNASIGVVSYPEDGSTLSELLKNADIAMYQAKRNNTGFSIFCHQHAQQINKRVSLEQDLRQAVEQNELILHFQPRVRTSDGAIHSIEALARWHHPDHGWISPAEFIPVAESCGIIHDMGKNLLEAICHQLLEWRLRGIDVRVAMNVSVLELQRNDFIEQVEYTLQSFGIEGHALEIEITESAAMTHPDLNIKTLAALKDLGIHIAIDDFGTGYSSLSYLKRLPVDSLKIDQSFVNDMTVDTVDAGIIESIVTLAKSMDLQTVAEGVETAEQGLALRSLACDYLQGYLFCKPLPADEIEPLLTHPRVKLPWEQPNLD